MADRWQFLDVGLKRVERKVMSTLPRRDTAATDFAVDDDIVIAFHTSWSKLVRILDNSCVLGTGSQSPPIDFSS